MLGITIEQLKDVVESQLCVHGDKALFIYGMEADEDYFFLLSEENTEDPIIDCVPMVESDVDGYGLQVLSEKLNEFSDKSEILCSDDNAVIRGFKLGFKAEGQFVLTLDSNELAKPTVVG